MAVVAGTNANLVCPTAPTADPAGLGSVDWDGKLFAQTFTTPAFPVVVSQIGWYQDNNSHGAFNWECAIYTNNATPTPDEPGTVVGSISTGWTCAENATGWQTATGLSISLAANTVYWIALGIPTTSGSVYIDYASTGGVGGFTTDSAGTLDSTWTGTFTATTAGRLHGVYALRPIVELVRYVDTDVVGGAADGTSWANAFATLSAWEAAGDDAGDLVTNKTWMHAYYRGNTQDTTVFAITGWTTGVDNYIHVEASADSTGKHAGYWDDGKVTLAAENQASGMLGISEDYVILQGFQIQSTESSVNSAYTVNVTSITAAGSNIRLKNMILKGVASGTGKHFGLYVNDVDATVNVENCLIYGFYNASDVDFCAVRSNTCTALNIYSSAIFGSGFGIDFVIGAISVYNSVIFNNVDDFDGTIACDYCASDDADASTYTNGVNFTSEATDWAAIFTDYTYDLRLKDYTGARKIIDMGSSKTLGDPDVAGTARGATWDIGPFEFVSLGLSINVSDCTSQIIQLGG